YSYTGFTHSIPYSSIIFTMALPTITPSPYLLICLACPGVENPNPTAQGMFLTSLTSAIITPISVVISSLTPCTPIKDKQYTNPSASFPIILILSWEVGAMNEIRLILYFLQRGLNSSFSSKGRSGIIIASMAHREQFLINLSDPYV